MFEIRFPAGFPHAPPFFRILKPRFLGFSQVGRTLFRILLVADCLGIGRRRTRHTRFASYHYYAIVALANSLRAK